jgi:hypothetical protein
VLIPLVSWDNLLKCFNPAEEPLYRTAFLVEFRIKPERSPSLRLFPGSSIDRDIALDPSFPVVLSDFLSIVGCICGDDPGTNRHLRDLKCFDSWLVEPGIVDICWCNRAGKREAVPIDQSTQFVPVYLFIAIIADGSPFFAGISLVSVAQCERSIFLISYPDRSRSRKIA